MHAPPRRDTDARPPVRHAPLLRVVLTRAAVGVFWLLLLLPLLLDT